MTSQTQYMRGGAIFTFYALAVCVVAALGLSVKLAELGFQAADTYFFGQLHPLDEEWLQEDEHVLNSLNWSESEPPPNRKDLPKIKRELRAAWELNTRRYGNEKIVQAGFEAIAFAILWVLHWRWVRRQKGAIES